MSKSVLCNRSSSADPIHHVKKSNAFSNKPTASPSFTCRREVAIPSLSHPCLYDAFETDSYLCSDSEPTTQTGDSIIVDGCISYSSTCLLGQPTKVIGSVSCHSSVPTAANRLNATLTTPTFVGVSHLVNIIQQLDENECLQMDCVLLDARENRLYQTSHLRHACSASCYTKTMAKRSVAAWASTCARQQHPKDIYIYDQKTCAEQGVVNAHLQFFIDYLQQRGNRVFILDGGLVRLNTELPCEVASSLFESCMENELVDRYTFSPTNAESASVDVLNATASEINANLWLGNERDAHDWELLKQIGITHILNVTTDVPNYFEQKRKLTYHRLRASDNHGQDLLQFFEEAHDFIEHARSEGGRILVHCWAGVSRSATIVVSYVMRSSGCSPSEALEFVRKKRNIVAPNFNFMGQLERFYESCKLLCQPLSSERLLWDCAISEGSSESGSSVQTTPLAMSLDESSTAASETSSLCLLESTRSPLLLQQKKEESAEQLDPMPIGIAMNDLPVSAPDQVTAIRSDTCCKSSLRLKSKGSAIGRLRLTMPSPGSAPPPPVNEAGQNDGWTAVPFTFKCG